MKRSHTGTVLTRVVSSLAVTVVLCSVLATALLAAIDFPQLSGRVVDEANVLRAAAETRLTSMLRAHEDMTTNQIVVATVPSLQGNDIRDFGYQLGRHWAIGQADKNNGVLLLVAPNDRKVAIEVGYGLEGVLTDATAKLIIENKILPRFRSDDLPGGIRNGVAAIIAVLENRPLSDLGLEQSSRSRGSRQSGGWSSFFLFLTLAIAIIWISKNSNGTGAMSSGYGRGSSSRFGGSSGGFSGGGGSFGGGGASGGW